MDRQFKINTRHYGDLESLRTNVTYAVSAVAVSAVCVIIFTKLLEKRTIKAGYNAISAISFVALVTLIFNLLRPATRLSLAQLKNSEMVLNSCVYSIKGGKKIHTLRDCYFGEDGSCSLKNPCTPCNPIVGIDANVMFDVVQSIYKGQQCRKCTSLNQACPGKNEESKNYCKKQAYNPLVSANERTINGSVAQYVAGWEVVHVEKCATCCVTNRTMEFFADRKLSEHHGGLNIGINNNISITGYAVAQPFKPIYDEIMEILARDPAYFVAVGAKPNRSMINYTYVWGVDL